MAARATARTRLVSLALVALGVVAELGLGLGLPGQAFGAPALAAATPPATWTTYHHDNQRGGYDAQQPAFGSSIVAGWAAPTAVDGAVYAEPLVVGNTVVVATEQNSVYALNAATGAVLWHDNLGPPVPNSSLPCGNVNPVGITSTPVIDATAGIVYAVGLVQPSGQAMNYQMAAINLASGAINYQHVISISGLDPQHHNQRGALTLLNGTVYVPFGGRYGDCGPYEGWLVGLPASGSGSAITFRSNTDGNAAGFWQPAGATVDGAGNLYVTSGNTIDCGSPTNCTYDGGETVYKLTSALSQVSSFYPSNWATLDSNDTDIGSTPPLPVNGNLIFQVGKSGDGYLVRQGNLGGKGGQAFTAHVCPNLTSDAAFGGAAYVDPYIYVPCSDGVEALRLNSSAPSFAVAWHGPSESYASPPIVDGGLVWTVDTAGTLFALNPTTGATVFSASVGAAATFATPAAGDGAVFVAAAKKVYAFVNGGAPTPTATSTSTATNTPTATATHTPTSTPTATATPTITPTPGGTLLSDTFEPDALGSTPADWSVAAATPSQVSFKVIQDGSHVVQHSNWGGKLVINQSVGWTDVSVSLQVKTSGWGNSAQEGIAARLSTYQHYLRLVLIGTTTLELDAVNNGTATKLASVAFNSSGGVWYTLRLDVTGSALTGYVNGKQLISATAPSGYASGSVGIDSSTPVEYDNVSVTSPGNGGGTPTPTPTATATATATPTASPTATATATPTSTTTATATPTVTPTATPTITPTPGGTLFSDTFEPDALGSTPTGWSVAAATPSQVSFKVISDGSQVVQHTNWGGKLVINNSATWSNVSVSLQVKTSGWGNSAKEGIAVRLSDYQHYLRLVLIGTSTLEIDAVNNGTATPLASVPFASSGGTWYTLRLDAAGSTLTGFVNGQALITATAPSGYASGSVGIDSSTPAEYDNVVVTSL